MLKKSCVVVVLSMLIGGSGWAADPKQPKYGPDAAPLSVSHEYFEKHTSPTFWSLIPYYIAQRDGRSCSLASLTMIVNAVRGGVKLLASQPLVTQDHLMKKVDSKVWNRGLGLLGHGISLDQLGPLMEESFKAYDVKGVAVETVHIPTFSPESVQKLEKTLEEMEKTGKVWVVSNFLQSFYTGDAEIGHISPIGAYDSAKKKVLVLDTDREWYEPYWVSLDTFIRGMATKDSSASQNRGYLVIRSPL